jgi:hypothetical protein
MNRDHYWALIDRTRAESGKDPEEQAKLLQSAVSALSAEEILDFEKHTTALLDASYRNRLWGAAYLINGGCSDDGFDYFRGWLIAQGRATYEAALANPDSLADCEALGDGDVELEALWYIGNRAYEAKTGEPIPDTVGDDDESEEEEEEDFDVDFDDDEAMQEHYPRLYARFC